MLTLKNYQREAVDELKKKAVKLLNSGQKRKKLGFKAPTGSGKTVMASAFMDELAAYARQEGSPYGQFAFIWLSPNMLHLQSFQSVLNYFAESRGLHPVMWNDVNPSEGLKANDVLFLNWQSINKDNAILIRDNETNRTLGQLVHQTSAGNNLTIVAMIDEEHYFASNYKNQSDNALRLINPALEVRISATPKSSFDDIVVIQRSDVIAEEMIKQSVCLNPAVKNNVESDLTMNQSLLKQALERRNCLAELYRREGSAVNPLLLIQLPNDTKESLNAEERTLKAEVETYLRAECDITTDNGRLAVWLSNEKENKEGLEQKDSLCEVLLFKQAIALGWDCPRAHVLLIFREMKDVTFTTQTVGRILRMPELRHYTQPDLNVGFVYTNLSAEVVQVAADDMDYLSTIVAHRRLEVPDLQLPSIFIDRHLLRNRLSSKINGILRRKFGSEKWFGTKGVLPLPDDDGGSTDSDAADDVYAKNRQKAEQRGFLMDVKRIFVTIPSNTQLSDEEGIITVTDTERMAVTQGELRALLLRFCRQHVGHLAPADSVGILRTALINIMEEFFGFIEDESIKVLLHSRNQGKFAAIVDEAVADFEKMLHESGKDPENNIKVVDFEWQLPQHRIYNLKQHISRENEIRHHALEPFFEDADASYPEYRFARLLDSDNNVMWWYKNGDNGKQHFAVPYTNQKGEVHAFYVDFIVCTQPDDKGVSTICLFDTKTAGSDVDAPEKHNALVDYINQWNNPVVTEGQNEKETEIIMKAQQKNTRMVGGVIIEDAKTEGNWYYSPLHIDTTDNHNGWELLEFNRIRKGE